MTAKRKALDFIWAFVAVCIVFAGIALLTGQSFFEDCVEWNGEEGILRLFGTELAIDRSVCVTVNRLYSFNDVLFGRGFANATGKALDFFADYIRDGVSVIYFFAQMAVGLVQ